MVPIINECKKTPFIFSLYSFIISSNIDLLSIHIEWIIEVVLFYLCIFCRINIGDAMIMIFTLCRPVCLFIPIIWLLTIYGLLYDMESISYFHAQQFWTTMPTFRHLTFCEARKTRRPLKRRGKKPFQSLSFTNCVILVVFVLF